MIKEFSFARKWNEQLAVQAGVLTGSKRQQHSAETDQILHEARGTVS